MATMKDIAKLAGTSIGTVSMALNGSPSVKHETRYRILQIASELNYRPNQAARSLVTRETKVVALFRTSGTKYLPNVSNPFASNVDTLVLTMLPSIQSRIREEGYSILVDTFEPEPPDQFSPVFTRATIDGAFFFGGMIQSGQLKAIQDSGIPSVLICSRDNAIDFVDTDPGEGVCMAVDYMVQRGHRCIALINGAKRSQASTQKLTGYRQALQDHAIPYDPDLVEFTDFSGVSVWAAMDKLAAKHLRPTAFIGGTDYIACAILGYLHKNNLRCPQDVSVIGYEDTAPAAYSTPAITSIDIHKHTLGQEAANILLGRIKNPKARHVGLIIPPTLVERDSVMSRSGT